MRASRIGTRYFSGRGRRAQRRDERRLFTEVRERRGLCYSVYATYHTLLRRGTVFSYAGTNADRARRRST